MSTETLQELLATQAYLKNQVRTLTEERNALPRNDKQNAHRLLIEITRYTNEEKAMRPSIARAREAEERQEQHNLWCACVIELYGAEELPRCFEWMKQERKARRAAQAREAA
jgi:hypothetical protein